MRQSLPRRSVFVGLCEALLLGVFAACAAPQDEPYLEGQGGSFKIGEPYTINGKSYRPKRPAASFIQTGVASWYGEDFHGRKTANGEIFDMNKASAAHRTLPLPSYVQVRNLENGRELTVRVNDRGPFTKDRVIDLSRHAAEVLGFKEEGTARVELRFIRLARLQEHQTPKIYDKPPRGEPLGGKPLRGKPRKETRPGEARPAPPTAKTPPAPETPFYVQAGSFSSRQRAEAVGETLLEFGKAQIIQRKSGDETLYAVRLGPFFGRLVAEAIRANLRAKGVSDAFITEKGSRPARARPLESRPAGARPGESRPAKDETS